MLFFTLTGPALAVMGMGIVFMLLILPGAAAWGMSYGISTNALILKRPQAGKRLYFNDIESIFMLSKEQARSFMEELYYDAVESERRMDMGGWLRSNRRAGEVTRYLSIPVTGTETRRGNTTNITSFSVRPDSRLILIREASGGKLLISPKKITELYTELVRAGLRTIPPEKGEGRIPTDELKANRKIGAGIRVFSAVVFVVILAAVGYFVIYPSMTSEADRVITAENETVPEQQSEIPGVMAAWVNEDTYLFGVLKEELPEMEQQGGLSAMLYSSYASPLLLQLLEAEGELPAGASSDEALNEFLSDFLMLHCRMKFAQEHTYPDGSLYMIYTVESPEFKKNIPVLLKNRL